MGGSLSSPFLLRKSISNHFSRANEKLCFTLHSALLEIRLVVRLTEQSRFIASRQGDIKAGETKK
jgi:hypothetical protein